MFKSWRVRLSAGAAILLVLGLSIGWLMADDGSDAKLAAPAEIWKEPTLQRADTAKLQASLAQHSLWGDAAPAAGAADAAKAAASSWKLTGIVDEDGTLVAVIQVTEAGATAPKSKYPKSGDELPDGSHIVEISKTSMTVAGDSGQRQVRLFFPN
jgi:hypothetical protein